MKKDIGFWDINGNYIPDIQEVSEVEMDKEFKENPVIAYEQLKQKSAKQKEMIERQWKLLEQCGVSAGGELKRVSYLLERLREENERLKLSERDLSRICQGFKKDIETEKSYTLKYHTTLQEIKELLNQAMDVRRNAYSHYSKIAQALDIITKVESEDE